MCVCVCVLIFSNRMKERDNLVVIPFSGGAHYWCQCLSHRAVNCYIASSVWCTLYVLSSGIALGDEDMQLFHFNSWLASIPASPKCYRLICLVCLSLLIKLRTLTSPTTLDMAVLLIKVLIELNGCSNEQMSSIKSKESDRPINERAEHNYNI